MSMSETKTYKYHICTIIKKWVKSFAIFWYVIVRNMYIIWQKQFKLWKIPVMIGSIMVVVMLICYALLHFMWDLKAIKMNM